MSEEKYSGSRRNSARSERADSGGSQQQCPCNWDFETYFPSDAANQQRRIRASSWDDSDDNVPPNQDNAASKGQIYTNDDSPSRLSVSSKINEIKKEFFKSRGYHENEENFVPLNMQDELEKEQNYDRRLSPARLRRRTGSPGSSSVQEMESPISPKKMNKSSESDTDFQEASPMALQYNPSFYLNNFFTDLRFRRISLMDPISMIETVGKEMPKHGEINTLEGRTTDNNFCQTSRKLSQILEVEEQGFWKKNPGEKENLDESPEESEWFVKSFKELEQNALSPLQTPRSKKSERIPETPEGGRKSEEYKSLSSEYLKSCQKLERPYSGSLSERSRKFFDEKLNDDFITLSAKTGTTRIGVTNPQVQSFFNTITTNESYSEEFAGEKHVAESPKIDLTNVREISTPTAWTNRSGQKDRKSGRGSRRSHNAESPKFAINLGQDSARSLKVEDVNLLDSERNDNSEEPSFRTNASERNTERILPSDIKSPSGESVVSTQISSRKQEAPKNRWKIQKSHRKRKKQRSSLESESKEQSDAETTERHIPNENYHEKAERTPKSSKTSAKTTNTDIEQTSVTESPISVKFSKSPKVQTPKTVENRFLGTPRTNIIPELTLQIDTSERPDSQKSSRGSVKTVDSARKDSDGSETKRRSRRQSERSSSSRSRRTASPRTLKSKESLENRDDFVNLESTRTPSWKESDKVSSASSASSWREADIPSPEHFHRSEVYKLENTEVETINKNLVKEKSRNSSEALVSPKGIESKNNSARSRKPNSGTPKRCSWAVPEVTSIRCSVEEDEDAIESLSSQKSKTGDESDRPSVINEVCFENLETNNPTAGKAEKYAWEYERRSSQATNETPPEETSTDEGTSTRLGKSEGEQWNELIKKFNEGSNGFNLENFPGFSHLKDISWNCSEGGCKDSKENLLSRNAFLAKNKQFEKSTVRKEDLKSCFLEYQNPLLDNAKQDDFTIPVQSPQSIYCMNIDRGAFGIGEFGDVTCWNAGDSDTKDHEKPKGHGDGILMARTPEVRLEKNENEIEAQLRRDFLGSIPPLNKQHQGGQDEMDFLSCRLKTSKSDNCINKKDSEDEYHIPPDSFSSGCKFKSDVIDLPEFEERNTNIEVKSSSKSTINQNSSSESLGKYWENLESGLAHEKIPRLSRSLSNLDIHDTSFFMTLGGERRDIFSILGNDFFKRAPEICKADKDSTNLSIYLERKAKEDTTESNNWLTINDTERNNSFKRGKKTKTKFNKKGEVSPKSQNPFPVYLSSRKSRRSVPNLKLRNSNCFQNFYKRFIGVFCITSNSSASTSK